ncbi:MAG: hypothetical protein GXO48_01825 [Chlorobi bacterium]|nr:hypothetical protein [Chlorobiota bacterium]
MRKCVCLKWIPAIAIILLQTALGEVPVLQEKHLPILKERANHFYIYFQEAYQLYPSIPRGLLEAISFEISRWNHFTPSEEAHSHLGMPQPYGVMGLVYDTSGFFRSNLLIIAEISGYSIDDLINSPRFQIIGYAAALNTFLKEEATWKNINKALRELSEIIVYNEVGQYAQDVRLYHILRLMEDEQFMSLVDYNAYQIPWEEFFHPENLEILRGGSVILNKDAGRVTSPSGNSYRLMAPPCNPPEYPGAIWKPAHSSNYSSRSTNPTHIVIHTIQGSYSSAINWFQNPSANVSAHYVISSWGEVTQMVCENKKAWHVRYNNNYTIGYEHEGYVSDPIWYTDTMYSTSAGVTRSVCQRWNINRKRVAWFPWAATTLYRNTGRPGSCVKIKGHQHYPNQTHTDPGSNWDWEFYFRKINGLPSNITTYTASSGTFYDSGGPTGNYSNDEFRGWIINPPGNNPVVLTFSQFNLENQWDYLYIWDGTGPDGRFIGYFTGTNNPGTIIGYSGSLYIEFRSDCATTRSGWKASWSTQSVSCLAPANPTIHTVQPLAAFVTWRHVPGATHYTVAYKRHYYSNWIYVTTTDSFLWLTGLAASSHYQWRINAHCSATDSSRWIGGTFTTLQAQGSWSITSCSGFFADAGGPHGNYMYNENWTFTINSPNGNPITVSFSSFNTQTTYDKLYIYDGSSTSAPLVGVYHGTNSPGTITSSGGSITFRFRSNKSTQRSGWFATWSVNNCTGGTPPPPPPPGPGTPSTTAGARVVSPLPNNWITSSFTAIFKDSGAVKERFYLVTDLSSDWYANSNRGFFYDRFATNSGQWTPYSGQWSWLPNSGILRQSDEINSNTSISAYVNQNVSNIILYRWRARIDGSGTNKRAGLHFFADTPSLSNRGNSYFVYFREDHDKVQIYKVTSNSWSLVKDVPYTIQKNKWYIFSVVFNRISGQIDVYVDTVKVASWTDPSPHSTGRYISLRSGNCIYDVDWLEVWRYRPDSTAYILVGSGGDIRFESPNQTIRVARVHTVVTDSAERLSTLDPHIFTYLVDFSPPSGGMVNDGTGSDIDSTILTNSISGNWSGFNDPNSGLAGYQYSVGLAPGDSSVLPWTSTTTTSFINTTVTLIPGQTYYINVRAYNNAGLISNIISSDGFIVLSPTQPTTFVTAPTWITDSTTVNFSDHPSGAILWRFYNVASHYRMHWTGNNNLGFIYDDFDSTALSSSWVLGTGTWTASGTGMLSQQDETESNTALSIYTGNLSGQPILYHWKMRINGNGSNKRGGAHICANNIYQSNRGNSYLIYLREDQDVLHVVKTTNNVFANQPSIWNPITLNAGTWYDVKVAYDPSTGKILVFINDTLKGSWTDPNPLTQCNFLSLRTGNAVIDYDFVKVYKFRSGTSITVNAGHSMELFLQNPHPDTPAGLISSIVIDTHLLVSPITQTTINVDWTSPFPTGSIYDITSTDADTLFDSSALTTVTIFWDNFFDPNSGIEHYSVALGTSPGIADVTNWQTTTATFHQWTGLNLSTNTWYFASVKATNNASLEAAPISSDGFIIIPTSSISSWDTSGTSPDSTVIDDNPDDSISSVYNPGLAQVKVIITDKGLLLIASEYIPGVQVNIFSMDGRLLLSWEGDIDTRRLIAVNIAQLPPMILVHLKETMGRKTNNKANPPAIKSIYVR